MTRSVKEWQEYIHSWAKGKGWYDNHGSAGAFNGRNLGEMLMLCVTELSEAMEEYRGCNPDLAEAYEDRRPEAGHPDYLKPGGFSVELADCVIRILDLCEYCNIDLEAMIELKMQFNEGRPYRHGGKRA